MEAMPSSSTILLIDDDPAIRMCVSAKLLQGGHTVIQADGLQAARAEFARPIDLALVDYSLRDGSGFDLLEELRDEHPEVPAIMLTGHASVSHAVAAMKVGAFDYLGKPVDLEELRALVDRALEETRVQREYRAQQQLNSQNQSGIEGRSPQMSRVAQLVSRIAASPGSTVLVTGESGTGKDLVARAIHRESSRAGAPFLNITCSALPAALLESELFGHERGAFTDAKQRKIGLLEHAEGGTVFLDEIGELELGLQAKLLRFLEDKNFRRVGGNVDIHADVRFVAATNVDLREAVKQSTFRSDLYYRLAVLMISLPALREREGDAERLAMTFVTRFNREFDRNITSIAPDALEFIRTYPWPGNVRELKNAIERAVLLTQTDVLRLRDFEGLGKAVVEDSNFKLPAAGVDMRDVEKSLVEQALNRTSGNRTGAAKLLGMNRDQIRYRIDQFGLESKKKSSAE